MNFNYELFHEPVTKAPQTSAGLQTATLRTAALADNNSLEHSRQLYQ